MRTLLAVHVLLILSALWTSAHAQETPEMPEMPRPTAQHQWLQKLAGDWDTSFTIHMPGQPPMTNKGTAVFRPIGGFWIISELHGEMMGAPFQGVQTLGFSAEKQEFIGTWVDSMSDYQWNYRGQLNDDRTSLTLLCAGPCPLRPGELSQFKEVLEVKGKDQLTFTSSVQDEDGEWATGVVIEYRRKK